VAAGTFALATQWTLHHDPAQPPTQVAAPAVSNDLAAVQRDARLAARRLARVQAAVVRLESSLQQRSARTDRLQAAIRKAQQGRHAREPGVQPGGTTAALPTALPTVQVPTVHTTTGASGAR
jgi:hypothetical protein